MKDRHIQSTEDSELLNQLYLAVSKIISKDKGKYTGLLIAKFIIYFSILLISYLLLFFWESEVGFIVNFIIYGLTLVLLAFNFSHDFAHSTVFKSPFWNQFGFMLTFTLMGAHSDAWKYRHVNSHHYAPNVQKYDSDLRITSLIRVSPESTLRGLHRFQQIYAPFAYMIYSLFWIFIKDPIIFFKREKGEIKNNLIYSIIFWTQKVIYILLILILPLLFSGHSVLIVLIGFFAMHFTLSIFLLFTFFMTHHVDGLHYPTTDKDGIIHSSWMMNQIKSSNDMHPFSMTANFILGGFNNHIAHHLFPKIHHLHYPEISRKIYSILRENNIEPHYTSYWGGVVAHLKHLKLMGRT